MSVMSILSTKSDVGKYVHFNYTTFMSHIKNLALLFVAQAICISCATNKVAPNDSKLQISAENICEPPAQYLGNYVTGNQRSYGTGDEKFYETFEYEVIPAKNQWIDGKHEGVSIEYLSFLAKYKTEKEEHEIPVKNALQRNLA